MLLNSGSILDFPKSILSLFLSFIFLAIICYQFLHIGYCHKGIIFSEGTLGVRD